MCLLLLEEYYYFSDSSVFVIILTSTVPSNVGSHFLLLFSAWGQTENNVLFSPS